MKIKKIEKCGDAEVITTYEFDEYLPNPKLLELLNFLGLDNKGNGITIVNNSTINKKDK